MKKFFKENINAALLAIIIGLISYINLQNQKAMDTLIVNTTLLKENDIKQDFMIVLNEKDISEMQSDIEKMQKEYSNDKLLTKK